jgi:hypothetical protein
MSVISNATVSDESKYNINISALLKKKQKAQMHQKKQASSPLQML